MRKWGYDEAPTILKLKVPRGQTFQCGNLCHFALALMDLDVKVRVHDGPAPALISGGTVSREGEAGLRDFADGASLEAGRTVSFEVVGPDSEEALPIIEETSARGRENHLPTLRKYWKVQREKAASAGVPLHEVALRAFMGDLQDDAGKLVKGA